MEANPTSSSPTTESPEGHPAVIDAAALRGLDAHGGLTLVRRMIDLCTESSAKRVADIRGAQARADLPAVARAAHSLKSSAGIIGARRLQDLADRVYLRADSGDGLAVAGLAAQLPEVFRQTLGRIEELRREWAA